MNVSMEIDNKTGSLLAAYIRVQDAKVHRTVEIKEDECYAHEDANGNLVGIELLAAGEYTWVKSVSNRYNTMDIEQALGHINKRLAIAA